MNNRARIAKLANTVGAYQALHAYWGKKRLTVLNYHRITDATDEQFIGYYANVSTDASGFDAQMQFVSQKFNGISLDDLVAHIVDGTPLPDYPLLITFDDGYLDNYEVAFPILKKYGLNAVIFLMTRGMEETHHLPWWDASAEIVKRANGSIKDALAGKLDIAPNANERQKINSLISYLKTLPESQKLATLDELQTSLNVDLTLSEPMFMNWEQVRDIVSGGVACQPHTHTHPILTRIDLEQARQEVKTSIEHIRQETTQAITAFAYPNGTPVDYNPQVVEMLQSLGIQVAFTLSPGPMPINEVHQDPLLIRRVYLSRSDTLDIFKAKVMGLPYLLGNVL